MWRPSGSNPSLPETPLKPIVRALVKAEAPDQPVGQITAIHVQPMAWTASFWGAAIGAALSVPRATRPYGAALLMLIGYGGVGVAWERTTGCDLRRWHRPPLIAVTGTVTHLPLAIAGHLLLRSVRNERFKFSNKRDSE